MVMIKKIPDEIHFSKYGYARLRLIFTRLHLAGLEPPPDFLAIPQIYTSPTLDEILKFNDAFNTHGG